MAEEEVDHVSVKISNILGTDKLVDPQNSDPQGTGGSTMDADNLGTSLITIQNESGDNVSRTEFTELQNSVIRVENNLDYCGKVYTVTESSESS